MQIKINNIINVIWKMFWAQALFFVYSCCLSYLKLKKLIKNLLIFCNYFLKVNFYSLIIVSVFIYLLINWNIDCEAQMYPFETIWEEAPKKERIDPEIGRLLLVKYDPEFFYIKASNPKYIEDKEYYYYYYKHWNLNPPSRNAWSFTCWDWRQRLVFDSKLHTIYENMYGKDDVSVTEDMDEYFDVIENKINIIDDKLEVQNDILDEMESNLDVVEAQLVQVEEQIEAIEYFLYRYTPA